MTDEVKLLNSKESIPEGVSPLGIKYKAFREGEPTLWTLWAVRVDAEEKVWPDKNRSQPIEGMFTSEAKALDALRRWLSVAWADSDQKAAKLAKRNAA